MQFIDEPGIYKILNTITGGFYIGSAVNIRRRWFEHIKNLKGGRHVNRHLQNAWNKYGRSVFFFCVVKFVDNKVDLITEEQKSIDEEMPVYNILKRAGSVFGYRHTEKTKKKISESKKGQTSPMKGKKITDETKNKLRLVNLGKKQTTEAKLRQIEAQKGRRLSNDTKIKIGSALKGKRHSAEHVEKIRLARLGSVPWNKARTATDLAKTNMSIAQRARRFNKVI